MMKLNSGFGDGKEFSHYVNDENYDSHPFGNGSRQLGLSIGGFVKIHTIRNLMSWFGYP